MSVERSLVSRDRYLAGLLVFFYRAVRQKLLLVVLLPLVAMAITFSVARQLSPIYIAQANTRIGQVDGAPTTTLQAAVARANSQSFKEHLYQSMNLPGDQSARSVSDSLSARPATLDSLVVNVRGPTEDHLRQALEITARLLNDEQEKIAAPQIADLRSQLDDVNADMARLLDIRRSLSNLTKASMNRSASTSDTVTGDSDALRNVLLADLVAQNEQRISSSRAAQLALATRLNSGKTYPTAITDDVSVSRMPAFPRPMAISLLVGGVALLGAVLYALMSRRRIVRLG